jgi:prepilin-type N-terminal cleavage/methylation domain-containing protein
MLSVRSKQLGRPAMGGFSLIEMMVAIVIGAIVVAGAVAVIVAINQANSENIQSMRIHQELRSLASVVGDELKRARRLNDAIGVIGTGVSSTSNCNTTPAGSYCPGPFDSIDTSTAGCVRYGYQDSTQNDPSTTTSSNNFRAMYLDSTTKSIYLYVSTTATSFPACPTGTPSSAWIKLNSAQVQVTGMTFNCLTFGSSVSTSTTIPRSCTEIELTLQAQLAFRDISTPATTYTYKLPIFIRSGAVVTS